MTDTGVNKTLDEFFTYLQATPGSNRVNVIHSMCLMPLFNDLLGGKMKKFALKDKRFWESLIRKCFPNLKFSKDEAAMNTILYTGTANELPTSNNIPSKSIKYDLSKGQKLITPAVIGKKFWIAIPVGYSLDRLNNLSFGGDWIEGNKLLMENTTINNGQYHLYWWDSIVPAMSTYQIILK